MRGSDTKTSPPNPGAKRENERRGGTKAANAVSNHGRRNAHARRYSAPAYAKNIERFKVPFTAAAGAVCVVST